MTTQSNRKDYNYKEYIADTASDISSLPTDGVCPESTCFIIDTSKVYMLNTQKEWKEISK